MQTERSETEDVDAANRQAEPQIGLSRRVYVYFAGLLVLYGGLETCLSGWLTTYALRYGDKTLVVSEYTTLLLWMSLTVGRAGASAVMLRVGEKTVQRWGMALAAVFTAGLAMAHSAVTIAGFAVLLGLSLAPFLSCDVGPVDGGAADCAAGRDCAGRIWAGCGGAAVDDGSGVDVGGVVTGGAGAAVCCGAAGLLAMSWLAPKSPVATD